MPIPYLTALLLVCSDKGLHGIVSLSSSVAAPASIQAGAWPAAGTKQSLGRDAQQLQQLLDPLWRHWSHSTDSCGNKTPQCSIRVGVSTLGLVVIFGISSMAGINQPSSAAPLVLLHLLGLLNLRADKAVWIRLSNFMHNSWFHAQLFLAEL